jgi:hypothetical protein
MNIASAMLNISFPYADAKMKSHDTLLGFVPVILLITILRTFLGYLQGTRVDVSILCHKRRQSKRKKKSRRSEKSKLVIQLPYVFFK